MNSMMINFHHLSAVLLVMMLKFSDCHLLIIYLLAHLVLIVLYIFLKNKV